MGSSVWSGPGFQGRERPAYLVDIVGVGAMLAEQVGNLELDEGSAGAKVIKTETVGGRAERTELAVQLGPVLLGRGAALALRKGGVDLFEPNMQPTLEHLRQHVGLHQSLPLT